MKTQLLFFVFLCLSVSALARPGNINGRVTDDAGKPVAFASVLLMRPADTMLVRTELTNAAGEYQFGPVADGTFMIRVIMMSYDTYTSGSFAVVNNTITVPDIMLTGKAAQLAEVSVRAQKPFIEVHSDKLVVNVENSIVNAGSSVLDVLAKSPGVTVDNNDNLSLKGKHGVNVMVNGKIQPMTGEDLANMLKSMPSNAVESIELISNPSAKYDAAGTAGIINIKMKKDNKMGLNGSVNATYAQGVYGKANGGFNMNFRNKQFNLFASYNHSARVGFNHLTLDRRFFENGNFTGAYVQSNNYLYHITTDLGSLGMDYSLSSKTIIGMLFNSESTFFRRDGYNFSDVLDSREVVASHFVTDNSSPNWWGNYVANLNLRHSFDSAGRSLAVDADYAAYPNRGTQNYTTIYFGGMPQPSAVFNGDIKGLTQIRSFKADYTMPLKNKAKIEAGIKSSFVTDDNDLRFYNVINEVPVQDTGRTNHFIYNENINAGYLNWSKEGSKWSTQFGLRAEQTLAKGDARTLDSASSFDRSYVQLFPSFAVQRHLDQQNDLGITLSRRIARPSYEQLNPSPYYLDPTTYKAGYPYLNPALSYSAELSYIYRQQLITNLNYTRTSSPIVEVIQPSTTEKKVTIQTQKNLNTMEYFGISGSYQFQFYKWWSNTTNANVYYARYTGDIAGTNLNASGITFDVNSTNSFILGHNWSAELGGFYQAPQVYGYMNVKQTWMLNAGVQKNLFDKRATVRLNVTDIFWRGYPRATSYYNDYVESFIAQRDTRQASASFTWRFGKRSVPQAMRHQGGAEDEKRRAGNKAG